MARVTALAGRPPSHSALLTFFMSMSVGKSIFVGMLTFLGLKAIVTVSCSNEPPSRGQDTCLI